MKITIEIECPSCGGTGLYCGFCEAKGEAVVCQGCNGKGATNFSYNQFTGRKKKRGVNTIRLSRGTFVATGVGGVGASMSYSEFERKY